MSRSVAHARQRAMEAVAASVVAEGAVTVTVTATVTVTVCVCAVVVVVVVVVCVCVCCVCVWGVGFWPDGRRLRPAY